jgi:hypothetical protein
MARSWGIPLDASTLSTRLADLALARLSQGVRLVPCSVLGMVWLQTHFEDRLWEPLASGLARIDRVSAEQLGCDAEAAGLKVARLTA